MPAPEIVDSESTERVKKTPEGRSLDAIIADIRKLDVENDQATIEARRRLLDIEAELVRLVEGLDPEMKATLQKKIDHIQYLLRQLQDPSNVSFELSESTYNALDLSTKETVEQQKKRIKVGLMNWVFLG